MSPLIGIYAVCKNLLLSPVALKELRLVYFHCLTAIAYRYSFDSKLHFELKIILLIVSIYVFTTMEAEGEGWDPVNLA